MDGFALLLKRIVFFGAILPVMLPIWILCVPMLGWGITFWLLNDWLDQFSWIGRTLIMTGYLVASMCIWIILGGVLMGGATWAGLSKRKNT